MFEMQSRLTKLSDASGVLCLTRSMSFVGSDDKRKVFTHIGGIYQEHEKAMDTIVYLIHCIHIYLCIGALIFRYKGGGGNLERKIKESRSKRTWAIHVVSHTAPCKIHVRLNEINDPKQQGLG